MDYSTWKILKTEIEEKRQEYLAASNWCNNNGYHIEEDEQYYKSVQNPPVPEPSHDEIIKKQIVSLENQITDRNMRGAILGDEFALNKIQTIEAEIEELRRQLEG